MTKKRIIVTKNVFVFLGQVTQTPKETIVTDCFNIRRWGTTKGLGEIALSGPTSSTVLDDYGTVVIPNQSIIYFIECVA